MLRTKVIRRAQHCPLEVAVIQERRRRRPDELAQIDVADYALGVAAWPCCRGQSWPYVRGDCKSRPGSIVPAVAILAWSTASLAWSTTIPSRIWCERRNGYLSWCEGLGACESRGGRSTAAIPLRLFRQRWRSNRKKKSNERRVKGVKPHGHMSRFKQTLRFRIN
jgi:hypothetical protein